MSEFPTPTALRKNKPTNTVPTTFNRNQYPTKKQLEELKTKQTNSQEQLTNPKNSFTPVENKDYVAYAKEQRLRELKKQANKGGDWEN